MFLQSFRNFNSRQAFNILMLKMLVILFDTRQMKKFVLKANVHEMVLSNLRVSDSTTHNTYLCASYLGLGVYEAILEGVTTSFVKLPLKPGKLYELYAVAVDNVGNSQSLLDVDSTKLVVPNGIYL